MLLKLPEGNYIYQKVHLLVGETMNVRGAVFVADAHVGSFQGGKGIILELVTKPDAEIIIRGKDNERITR